nr:hypothetical protein BaRGS_011263 [Batillaria attramentaria]
MFRLSQMGFRTIDALDPSYDSLELAKQKGVYRNLFNVAITGEKLGIPQDSYDVVVLVGVAGPKHLPLEAFNEMIRLVKPGGYIVISCVRTIWTNAQNTLANGSLWFKST